MSERIDKYDTKGNYIGYELKYGSECESPKSIYHGRDPDPEKPIDWPIFIGEILLNLLVYIGVPAGALLLGCYLLGLFVQKLGGPPP